MMSVVREAARAAWRKASSRDEAQRLLLAAAQKDKALREALLDGALEARVAAALQAVLSYERAASVRGVTVAPAAQTDSAVDLSAWAEGAARSLLDDFRLPDGTRLGEATREQVLEAAAVFQSRGETLLGHARWLHAIAAVLKSGEVVSTRIDEARARQLQRRTLAATTQAKKSAA